jgi:hypothetical protein
MASVTVRNNKRIANEAFSFAYGGTDWSSKEDCRKRQNVGKYKTDNWLGFANIFND